MASSEDLVVLKRDDTTTATVHLHGATVISWICRGEERIFVSSKSLYDNKKAIRGGIPIVFPQFGPWDCGPQHGIARINRWCLDQEPTKTADGDIEVKFGLADNEHTRGMWDYKFKLVYTVTLKEASLVSELKVENTGNDSFTFTCLLHTYIKVPDIHKVAVSGLQGCTYMDKIKGGDSNKESNDTLQFPENIDRVYISTSDKHEITQAAGNSTLKLSKTNFPETVVWNPWAEKAKAMSDMGDEDYLQMVCVEPGLIDQPNTLAPGASFTASQALEL